MKQWRVYSDGRAVCNAVATRFILGIADLLTQQDRVDVAVTGGADGIDVLVAAGALPLSKSIDWTRVHFWWGDDRFVQADDPDRNAIQAREAWLDTLVASGALPQTNVHEMPADVRTRQEVDAASDEENQRVVDAAAAEYQTELERELAERPLDIMLFGVGPDSHFASLFPGHREITLGDQTQWVAGVVGAPFAPVLRVTMTVPFIQRSRFVWVFADGAQKADAVARAAERDNNIEVPSSFAQGTQETVWMIDRLAAQRVAWLAS